MRRRALGLAAVAATLQAAAHAQQPRRRRRVGVFIARVEGDAEGEAYMAALREQLTQHGWSIGRDLDLDVRWMFASGTGLESMARELVALASDVLVVNSSALLRAARGPAGSIPIVFVAVADPLGQGLVANLSRPGGTMTGFGVEEASMGGKWLELLHELAPRLTSCVAVMNPRTSPAASTFLEPMRSAGAVLGIEVTAAEIGEAGDYDRAFAAAAAHGARGAIVVPDIFAYAQRERIVGLAARHGVPAVYYHRGFVDAGGVLAFGIERVDQFRRAAGYVHQILAGARAGDLPVQMPAKFELVINLRSARALGIAVASSLLARAEEVIE